MSEREDSGEVCPSPVGVTPHGLWAIAMGGPMYTFSWAASWSPTTLMICMAKVCFARAISFWGVSPGVDPICFMRVVRKACALGPKVPKGEIAKGMNPHPVALKSLDCCILCCLSSSFLLRCLRIRVGSQGMLVRLSGCEMVMSRAVDFPTSHADSKISAGLFWSVRRGAYSFGALMVLSFPSVAPLGWNLSEALVVTPSW